MCRIQKYAVEIQKMLTLCQGFDMLIVLGRSEDCPFFVPEVLSLEKNAITYRIVRSSRKTLSLEITARGQVLVRAPRRLSEGAIDRFIRSKEGWLRSRLEKYQNGLSNPASDRYMALIYDENTSAMDYIPADAVVVLCDQSSLHRSARTRVEEMGLPATSTLEVPWGTIAR